MLFIDAIQHFASHLRTNDRSEKTIYGYVKDLEAFNRYYEARNNCQCYVEDIIVEDVEGYLRVLKAKGLKPSSRNRVIHALKGLYKFLRRKGICSTDWVGQIDTVRQIKKERTFLTDEEVDQVIGAMDNQLMRTVTQTLFYTGLRISECLSLRFRNVDFENRVIYVIRGKGGKDRVIPMSEKLEKILQDYQRDCRWDAEPNEPVFATELTGRLCASYYNTYLRRIVERKLGWKKRVTAHTFRHSFASSLVKKEVNLVHIQKLLGHSSLAVTSVYTHANIEDLTKAVNVL